MPVNQNQRTARLGEVVRVLTRYGFADWVSDDTPDYVKRWFEEPDGRLLTDYTRAERVRLALTELGTAYIKLGQMLSTRDDLIGPDMAGELKKLQADTPPDPPDTVAEVVMAELGKPADELYGKFDFQALASASVGQVQAAELHDGTQVVVKLLHHGIEEKVTLDLDLMGQLATLLAKHGQDLPFDPVNLIRDFRLTLLNEIDLRHELRNLQRFRANFEDDPMVTFPKPHPELSTQRVLTMARFDGIKIDRTAALEEAGYDTRELLRQGANAWIEMFFRDRFYHADPHPGNLVALPGGVIGVLDCGMVGRIDHRMQGDLEDMLLAYVNKDTEQLAAVIMRICDVRPGFDRRAFESEIDYFLDDLLNQPLEDVDIVEFNDAIANVLRQFQLNVPASYISLAKTVVLLTGTGRSLDMSFNLNEMLAPQIEQITRRRLAPQRLLRSATRSIRDWEDLVTALPSEVNAILAMLRAGQVTLRHEIPRMDMVVNRVVLGLVATGLIIGSANIWAADKGFMIGEVSLLGALGLLLALYFIIRLWRSISASGGLYH